MAFYGSGASITNLVQGTNGTDISTTSNRNLSTSFVTHLSRTLTVPSGHTSHVLCIGHFAKARESSNGGYETRCVVSGSASHTGATFQNHRGYEDNDAGGQSPLWAFTLGAGSYTFSLQARKHLGDCELNGNGGTDTFVVQAFHVRD